MENAIAAYLFATDIHELEAAYEDMVHAFACDADLPDNADFESGVDAMLEAMGLPSLQARFRELV